MLNARNNMIVPILDKKGFPVINKPKSQFYEYIRFCHKQSIFVLATHHQRKTAILLHNLNTCHTDAQRSPVIADL